MGDGNDGIFTIDTATGDLSIDKTTGAGTVIGPIGFQAVAGLAARLERVVVSVNDDTPAIPTEYALHQNYPNPFNPVP